MLSLIYFYCLLFIRKYVCIYFFSGHLLAHPDTQAPNTRAENPGQTSIQACRTSPGQDKELLWDPPVLLVAGAAPEFLFWVLEPDPDLDPDPDPDPWLRFPFLFPPLLLLLLLRLLLLFFGLLLLLVLATGLGILLFWTWAPDPGPMVRFLGAPRGPGQGLHPSWVSLGSPWHVGYGSQVPSGVQVDRILGPMGHSNVQSPPGLSREQYPGIPGHIPGICSSLPGSCSIHRGTSVQVPSALIQENIFKYLNYILYVLQGWQIYIIQGCQNTALDIKKLLSVYFVKKKVFCSNIFYFEINFTII